MPSKDSKVVIGTIERRIVVLRRERVMLSPDLARLYGVEVRALNQAVQRNKDRFPPDFMFQLTAAEWDALKERFVTSGRGGIRRARPYAFTEQGIAMLSSVLTSKRAVQVNVEIMRAFVRLRQALSARSELGKKLRQLERRYNKNFKVVFDAIHELMGEPPEPPKRQIGFGRSES